MLFCIYAFNRETVCCCCCSGCGFVEGEEECREEVRTIVFDKPEETCTLDPRDQRRHQTLTFVCYFSVFPLIYLFYSKKLL